VHAFYEILNDKAHNFLDIAKYENTFPTRSGTDSV